MTPGPRAIYVHFRLEYKMEARFVVLMDCFLLSLVKRANHIHISSGRLPYLILSTVNILLFALPGFPPSQNEVKTHCIVTNTVDHLDSADFYKHGSRFLLITGENA